MTLKILPFDECWVEEVGSDYVMRFAVDIGQDMAVHQQDRLCARLNGGVIEMRRVGTIKGQVVFEATGLGQAQNPAQPSDLPWLLVSPSRQAAF